MMDNDAREVICAAVRETGPPSGSCPPTDDLIRFIARTSSPWRRARVKRHLGRCLRCTREMGQLIREKDQLSASGDALEQWFTAHFGGVESLEASAGVRSLSAHVIMWKPLVASAAVAGLAMLAVLGLARRGSHGGMAVSDTEVTIASSDGVATEAEKAFLRQARVIRSGGPIERGATFEAGISALQPDECIVLTQTPELRVEARSISGPFTFRVFLGSLRGGVFVQETENPVVQQTVSVPRFRIPQPLQREHVYGWEVVAGQGADSKPASGLFMVASQGTIRRAVQH